MEQEEYFYAIIKMVSGEEVFSSVSIKNNNEFCFILLENPVVLKYISKQNGTLLKLEPWIKFSQDDFFVVNMEKIITMTEIKDENMINFYLDYFEEVTNKKSFPNLNNTSENKLTKVSNKMGYISSVEDARNKLEDIYNII